MSVFEIAAIVSTAVGVAGQFADGYTTYEGVKEFGVGIEGDKGWLAQLIVKHFPLTLALKPAAFAGFGALLIAIESQTDQGSLFLACAIGAAAGILGLIDARANAKINATAKSAAASKK